MEKIEEITDKIYQNAKLDYLLLRELCKRGFLESSGFGKGTTYHLTSQEGASDKITSDRASDNGASDNGASDKISNGASSDVTSSNVTSSDVTSSDDASCKMLTNYNSIDNYGIKTSLCTSTSSNTSSSTSSNTSSSTSSSTSSDVTSSDVISSDVTSSDVTSSDVTSSDVTSSDVTSSESLSLEYIQTIKNYCKVWRTVGDISQTIGRNRRHTRNRIISKLLQEGILEMEYPDNPTHPAQRYRVAKSSNTKK